MPILLPDDGKRALGVRPAQLIDPNQRISVGDLSESLMKDIKELSMKILFSAFVALTFSQMSAALTVNEDDFVNDAAFESQTFVLDLGSNAVTGHQDNTSGSIDFDKFRFRVLPGLAVKEMTLTYSNIQLLSATTVLRDGTELAKCVSSRGPCNRLANSYQLAANDPSQAILWANLANSVFQNTETVIFPDQMPLTVGHYLVNDLALSKSGAGGSWDYTYAFNVVPTTVISLPPAGFLLGTALIGVSLRRRKIRFRD